MKEARAWAEKVFEPHPEGKQQYVDLTIHQVVTKPELFQPREFSYGAREVDKGHVKQLQSQMRYKENQELDPVLVIKLGDAWVCVDGHHRLAAYARDGRTKAIRCKWFNGDVRQAINASRLVNNIVKLNVPREDRYENAWKLTVLGWGSKREVRETCGVSDGTIGNMRRVKALYDGEHGAEQAARFKQRLEDEGGTADLEEVSWSKASMIWREVEPKALDAHDRAAKLAGALRSRMERGLSEDPKVTAEALALYDEDLPVPLYNALGAMLRRRWVTGLVDGEGLTEELEELVLAKTPPEDLQRLRAAVDRKIEEAQDPF
jgi:hypothetical protein